jgi:hypothetical protein
MKETGLLDNNYLQSFQSKAIRAKHPTINRTLTRKFSTSLLGFYFLTSRRLLIPPKIVPNYPKFVEINWPIHPSRLATELEQYTK